MKIGHKIAVKVSSGTFSFDLVECQPTGAYQISDNGDMYVEVEYESGSFFWKKTKRIMAHEGRIVIRELFVCEEKKDASQ